MWKRLLFVILLGCITSNILAQVQGKILIVSPGGIGSDATQLLNAVKPPYQGSVELDTRIPLDLTEFDALMILRPMGDPHAPWLDSLQQDRLISYVKAGGRFYAEGADFRNRADSDDDTTDNQFWDFIGDSEAMTAMVIRVDSAYGIANTFAHGVRGAPPYNPLRQDAGGGFHIDGMTPLLGTTGNYGVHLAWRSPDQGIKAVLHWPIIDEHYDAFIARVVCDYFQLCILDVSEREHARSSMSYNPLRSELNLPRPGSIVISDILGRTVMAFDADATTQPLPRSISKGHYIVRWESAGTRASTTIVVF